MYVHTYAHTYLHIHTHIHTYICIYRVIYITILKRGRALDAHGLGLVPPVDPGLLSLCRIVHEVGEVLLELACRARFRVRG